MMQVSVRSLNKTDNVVIVRCGGTVSCSLQSKEDSEDITEYTEKIKKLYREDRKLKPSYQTMDLISAKEKAVKLTSEDKKKVVFINVDPEGECELSNVQTEESIDAYSHGAEIPLPPLALSKEKVKQIKKSNSKQEKVMAVKEKKSAKKAGKKVAAKKEKATKKEKAPVAGKQKEITVKEIIALLKKGVGVYTLGGAKHNLAYCEKVGDKNTTRKVIIGE